MATIEIPSYDEMAQKLRAYRDNVRYFIENYALLEKEFLGEYVAIDQHKVVDHDKDLIELRQRLQKHGDISHIAIRKIETEKIDLLLLCN